MYIKGRSKYNYCMIIDDDDDGGELWNYYTWLLL